MTVSDVNTSKLTWRAYTDQEELWLEATFMLPSLEIEAENPSEADLSLQGILRQAQRLNPDFLSKPEGVLVETFLEFPRDWGLGSSSTLIHNVAQWAGVDGYDLLLKAFGGSGYDVKVAKHNSPIVFYRSIDGPRVGEITFSPRFTDQLWFIHLGQKQDSREEVTRFSEIEVSTRDIDQVSRITDEICLAPSLQDFVRLLQEHDFLMSRILARPSASEVFSGFSGMVKYLGAWGGDFVLATGTEQDMDYFRQKGMNTVLSYREMISP